MVGTSNESVPEMAIDPISTGKIRPVVALHQDVIVAFLASSKTGPLAKRSQW